MPNTAPVARHLTQPTVSTRINNVPAVTASSIRDEAVEQSVAAGFLEGVRAAAGAAVRRVP